MADDGLPQRWGHLVRVQELRHRPHELRKPLHLELALLVVLEKPPDAVRLHHQNDDRPCHLEAQVQRPFWQEVLVIQIETLVQGEQVTLPEIRAHLKGDEALVLELHEVVPGHIGPHAALLLEWRANLPQGVREAAQPMAAEHDDEQLLSDDADLVPRGARRPMHADVDVHLHLLLVDNRRAIPERPDHAPHAERQDQQHLPEDVLLRLQQAVEQQLHGQHAEHEQGPEEDLREVAQAQTARPQVVPPPVAATAAALAGDAPRRARVVHDLPAHGGRPLGGLVGGPQALLGQELGPVRVLPLVQQHPGEED
mmetsp:Transcript_28710/g.86825  ORF Transcript_28710/g.86825 Transcript_28710/m.86825 type:complete len:311 (+) Transcript_28710:2106-3038(+)